MFPLSGADGLLILGLIGTAVFAVNGALTAVQAAKLDIVGVTTLGTITALGGGITRDVLLGALPPEGLADWRYLSLALVTSALVFPAHRLLARFVSLVTVLDAAGLSLFCVTGTLASLEHGAGPLLAIILGTISGVGGGTYRDLLVGRIPVILTSGVYAIPAAIGATATMGVAALGWTGPIPYIAAAGLCFAIRMIGVHYNLNTPQLHA
ncbi:MAG TPA: trimeric intracellular cation channel family protein [Propionicimonas sp.]